MSKSTKIIAALGVVAGLGVAALPAFTYAAQTSSVSGAVKLQATVTPGIAMTIQSNGDADDTSTADVNESKYYAADPAAAGEGFRVDGYALYTTSGGLFTNWSSATVSLSQNDMKETATSIITVFTNDEGGYTLSVKDQDTNNALVYGNNVATIPAMVAETNEIEAGNAAWGLKGGDVADYAAVPVSTGSALVLQSAGSRTQGGEATNVTYGISTAADQPTGLYEDVIVYTATTVN